MQQKTEYFTRFPNNYIQGNIKTKYGVSRKFYITYILIDKYRSYEDYSWITLRKVLNFYGYKTHKRRPKAVQEILDVLEYMINNKMIEVQQDLDTLGYDTGIEIKIIPENFDAADKFSKITSSQLDFIMMNESSINKENILMAFLYINSYIFIRPKNKDNEETMYNPETKPEDQNKIQDVWHGLKEKHILPPENKYNDFRDMLIKLNLIIIDNNKRTRATEFAMKNKYFLVVKYNKAKDIYQYVISHDGLKYISANIQ